MIIGWLNNLFKSKEKGILDKFSEDNTLVTYKELEALSFKPIYIGVLTSGGTVNCPVFHNGTAWVSH